MQVVAAWLGLAAPPVVSYESALDLYEVSDVIPHAVRITLPPAKRGQRPRPDVQFHVLTQAPGPDEVRRVDRVVATNPERTIVATLQAGTQPERIKLAVQEALERGMTTPRRLRATAAGRVRRVQQFIDRVLTEHAA